MMGGWRKASIQSRAVPLNGEGKETPQEDKPGAGTSLQHSVRHELIEIQSQYLCQFHEEGKDEETWTEGFFLKTCIRIPT